MEQIDITPSRRCVIAALALGPVLAVSAVKAASGNPVTEFLAYESMFNAGGGTEEGYIAAMRAMDRWQPQTAQEFLAKAAAMFGGNTALNGLPGDRRLELLSQDAERLTV